MENVLNIGSRGETETDRALSNFARTPFVLNGIRYDSVEGFWQGLKFPEESAERDHIAGLWAYQAKKAGKHAPKHPWFTYQGVAIPVGCTAHHELMRLAIRAKLDQNPWVLQLLLDTGEKKITHVLRLPDGTVLPDSRTIPGAVFWQILMDLRAEFREILAERKQGYILRQKGGENHEQRNFKR